MLRRWALSSEKLRARGEIENVTQVFTDANYLGLEAAETVNRLRIELGDIVIPEKAGLTSKLSQNSYARKKDGYCDQ